MAALVCKSTYSSWKYVFSHALQTRFFYIQKVHPRGHGERPAKLRDGWFSGNGVGAVDTATDNSKNNTTTMALLANYVYA